MVGNLKSDIAIQRGFTLVELITIMVIMGILAAVAAPRFVGRNAFDSRGYYDQTLSTLRHAQKIAIAQRRFVCVAFVGSNITLTLDPIAPGPAHLVANCPGNNLTSPEGQTPYTISPPLHSSVTLAGGFADFSFSALGQPSAAQNITVSGYGTAVVVEVETGYVR